MVSFIIASKSKTLREQYTMDYCSKEKIAAIDINIFSKDSPDKGGKKKPTLSIGIDDIKKLQENIYFKPIQSMQKAIIIQDAQILTTEAQNALLKILEEPPLHTLIFLTTNSREQLLPTIRSRCKLVELASNDALPQELKDKLLPLIENLHMLPIASRLIMAEEQAKNKEEAIAWLENMITISREILLSVTEQGSGEQKTSANDKLWYSYIIRQLQASHTKLSTTNINTRMVLENLFLTLIPSS